MDKKSKYYVAIIGAGVAGAEAAFQFAQQGIQVALFEKKALPYGKIEDGLPKWHIKLRDQEEAKIDSKINLPNIQFIPKTGLGSDININDLQRWGFSAVLLAIGAGKDRPLPVPGIEAFEEKGLYYQNAFVSWYNHFHEPGYSKYVYPIKDDAMIIGGGLASLDVAKILMLETVLTSLLDRGINTNLFELERSGILTVLKEKNLSLKDLNIKGCTLYYRGRRSDMPLVPLPSKASPERLKNIFQLRERILRNYQEKYLFKVKAETQPVDLILENGKLSGLVFQRTTTEKNSTIPIPDSEYLVRSPLIISSIGSVPQPLPGILREGELLSIENQDTGLLKGFENVFVLGNALTGRGNIRESQQHGRKISKNVIKDFLSREENIYLDLIDKDVQETDKKIQQIKKILQKKAPLSSNHFEKLNFQINQFQQKVGYDRNFTRWIHSHKPVRFEDVLALGI